MRLDYRQGRLRGQTLCIESIETLLYPTQHSKKGVIARIPAIFNSLVAHCGLALAPNRAVPSNCYNKHIQIHGSA